MEENENIEQLDSLNFIGSSQSNPIQLQEIVSYGKLPNWFKRNILIPVNRFINNEVLLNKNNIRVKNALKDPEVMDAIEEGGNIAGGVIAAPVAAIAATETAPIWMPALNVAGKFFTPSTWIGGISNAFGVLAPTLLLNGADLGATAYFANEARKDINENGLNWKTGTNALLSLAPFTRDESAIKAVGTSLRNPVLSLSSIADDFRTARNAMSSPTTNLFREFNNAVKNTKFTTIPIEHVSTNGITEGAGLNAHSNNDVGFHFSPEGSSTTYNIQTATNAPFVRTGTWTYSNNTTPVFVIDKGNWRFAFNPEIYQGVNPGKTIAENTLALNQKGSNYTYINNYEGNGALSFMTTEPNPSVLLSKNINKDIDWINTPYIKNTDGNFVLADGTVIKSPNTETTPYRILHDYFLEYEPLPTVYLVNNNFTSELTHNFILNGKVFKIGYDPAKNTYFTEVNGNRKYFTQQKDAINNLLNERYNFIESFPDNDIKEISRNSSIANIMDSYNSSDNYIANKQIANIIKSHTKLDIENIYLSDEYIDRYMNSLGLNLENQEFREQLKTRIIEDINKTYDKATPIMYRDIPQNNLGKSFSRKDKSGYKYGINTLYLERCIDSWDSTLFHEFGHNLWLDNTPYSEYIRNYNTDILNKNLKREVLKRTKFNSNETQYLNYLSKPSEFRQRIMEGVRYGIKEGLTPEEIYNECNIEGFLALKDYFKKDFLVKMLGTMLGTTPIIVNDKKE